MHSEIYAFQKYPVQFLLTLCKLLNQLIRSAILLTVWFCTAVAASVENKAKMDYAVLFIYQHGYCSRLKIVVCLASPTLTRVSLRPGGALSRHTDSSELAILITDLISLQGLWAEDPETYFQNSWTEHNMNDCSHCHWL